MAFAFHSVPMRLPGLFALAGLAAALIAVAAPPAAAQTAPQADAPQPFDAVPADAASPFGGVSIAPTRLVLEGGTRNGRVTLYNSGDAPVTYRIESVDLIPLEGGGYAEPPEESAAPDWSAAPLLRYAPRQVTLQGGERQVVKIVSRARRDTEEGEYRTHLRFSSIPLVDEDGSGETESTGNTVSVSVGLQYRITIPVILRVGAPEEGTRIASARLSQSESGAAQAEVALERTGARSSYVTLRLLDAAGEEAGLIKGVSVLPPLQRRTVNVPVRSGAGAPVRVVMEAAEGEREGERLAEAAIG